VSRSTERWPRSVYGSGQDADPRFSLANERTCLAWIRTSLALLAVAVAVEAFELPIAPSARVGLAVLLTVMSLLCAGYAWVHWTQTERAMRHHGPMPAPLVLPLAIGVVAATIFVLLGIALR
jgi:Predicted membrane protein